MIPVEVIEGDSPVILGQPHSGTHVPESIFADLNATGRALIDTDWHVDRLYDGLLDGATVVRANFHRYVIDANRDPSGESLYPGQNTTALVPLTTFDSEPIWVRAPSSEDVARRRAAYHDAYHYALAGAIERIRKKHGYAILYDCHSIRSELPFLFEGRLPDLNVGTNSGETCAGAVERTVADICAQSGFSHVVNGRFRGGWTTRHYGRPAAGVHAIQMEIAQALYLKSEGLPFAYDAEKAKTLRATLREILQALAAESLRNELSSGG